MPGQPSSAGISDLDFVAQVRTDLRDPPIYSPEKTNTDGASLVYGILGRPHYDGDPYGTTLFNITVAGSQQTLVDSFASLTAAGQVYVDGDGGFMYWQVAPAAGANNLVLNHRRCRFTNRQIRQALYSGLRQMFPAIWQWRNDATFPLAVNQWEYTLPVIFADPRVRILRVEVQEIPASMERYRELSSWKRVAPMTLMIPPSQRFSPGASVRVTYKGPVASLSDLDAQSQELPILYALWHLLSRQEAPRARQDGLAATAGQEGVNPPGTSMNAALQYLQRFNQALATMAIPEPSVPTLPTYAR